MEDIFKISLRQGDQHVEVSSSKQDLALDESLKDLIKGCFLSMGFHPDSIQRFFNEEANTNE